jgi:hypothetical protein
LRLPKHFSPNCSLGHLVARTFFVTPFHELHEWSLLID